MCRAVPKQSPRSKAEVFGATTSAPIEVQSSPKGYCYCVGKLVRI